jgi:hypothetical protein
MAVLFLQLGVPLIGITGGCFIPAISAARQGNPFLFWVALLLAVVGIVLLFIARLSLYRQGKYWTFGSSNLPERNRKTYRAAYWFIGTSVFLLLVLLLALKGRTGM